jgi:hypothetical protein
MKWFALNIVAVIIFIILYPINLVIVTIKYGFSSDYFRSDAISLDKYGNRSYRTLFNLYLIKKHGYKFGNGNETISSVLGKNQLSNTLTKKGMLLATILNFIDTNHCIKSIDNSV